MSILSAIKSITPTLSQVYLDVRRRDPQSAGQYFDGVRGTIEGKFKTAFQGLESPDDDRVAPAYVQNFRTLWNDLPARPCHIWEQKCILRILYILAKQAETTENFLQYAGATDTTTRINPTTRKIFPEVLNFRDAQWSEIGKLNAPGELMQMLANFASSRMGLKDGIDSKALFKLFVQQTRTRIAVAEALPIAGFYTQKTTDHATQPSPKAIFNERIGEQAVPVDKNHLEIKETSVQLGAWESGVEDRSMAHGMLNDLLQDFRHDVFTIDVFQHNIPRVNP